MTNKTAHHLEDVYPLSPLQQGMLFQSLLHQESGVYLMQDRYRIGGELSVEAFLEAWRQVIGAHPALRTSFLWKTQKQPLQVVHRQIPDPVEYIDLEGLAPEQQEAHIQALLEQEQRNGFNLAKPPLIRVRLVRLGAGRHEMIRSFHHILMDAWCISLIMVDFIDAYAALRQGRAASVRKPRPYRDYIAWLQQQSLPEAQAFWQQQLQGLDAPTPLVIERHTRQSQYREAVLVDDTLIRFDAQQTRDLTHFCQSRRITPNTLFQGAWALLLSRYSGLRDVLFGVTVSGRPPQLAGVEDMIGLFINTLPLRVRIDEQQDRTSWLQALQRHNLALREFEHSALVDIQGWSDFPRGEELFDSILVYENAPIDDKLFSGELSFSLDDMEHSVHTHYGLTVVVMPGERLAVRISYDRRRFARDSIERLLGHLRQIVLGILAEPTASLASLQVLSAEERQTLLVDWNDTAHSFPLDRTYASLFAEQVARQPDKAAVVCAGESLSYAELDARASRLAAALIEAGAGPDLPVALLAERGLAHLTALIAILKAGACYLPLEVKHPAQRLAEILELSQAPLMLVGDSQGALADELCSRLGNAAPQCLAIETRWLQGEVPSLAPRGTPDNLAYVIFTSGSTGTPKGALVEQRGMLNNMLGKVPTLGLGEHDRIAQTASVAFDISVWQLLAAPLVGATVHILPDAVSHDPERLLQALQDERLTLWEAVPAVIRGVLAASTPATHLESLRWLLPTGEALPPALCRDWFARFPHVPLMNAYGPAECADDVAFHAITAASDEQAQAMPIGRPTPNTELYVLDDALRPVPVGVPGEICVAGAGVGRGYLNDAERTRAVFVDHPLRPGARFYRTGDLGRYRADGVIEFLGRRDQQVKIRGHRIELGEIEAKLQQHPSVKAAAVVVHADARGEAQLVGYWVVHEGHDLDATALKQALDGQLPTYMVPQHLVQLDALPLNANGKVDRKHLAQRELDCSAGAGETTPPATATEQALHGIWQDVLALEHFGVTDSFFALGGHSLLATQVLSRIRATFAVELPLKALFECPSVRQLAQAIDQQKRLQDGEQPASEDIVAAPRPERLPLSFAQQRLWFVEQLNPGSAHFNIPFALRLSGDLDVEALRASFQWLIERHEMLRTAFPSNGGQPCQRIVEASTFELPLADFADASEAAMQSELQAWFARPFDLLQPPLLRARLLRLGAREHVLAITLHHLVSDAWSATLALRELTQFYAALHAGQAPQLAPLTIQYADYSLWQQQRLQPAALQPHLDYWQKQLARDDDSDYLLELPTDRPRPAAQSHRSGMLATRLSPQTSERARALAARLQQSTYSLVFAAFATFLHRMSGQDDLILGTPVSNRDREQTQSLLGILLNNLPIRVRFPGQSSFAELARQVSETLLEAQRHQDLPFERLVDHLALPRRLSHAPLFQVMIAQQLPMERRVRFPDLDFEVLDTPLSHSEYDLDLHIVAPAQGAIELNLMFALDLFEPATAERWLQRFVHLFENLLEAPERPLGEHRLLEAREWQRTLHAWNDSACELPPLPSILDAFEAQVARSPQAVAVQQRTLSLGYAELDAQANRLAHHLREQGIGSGHWVALCLDKTPELAVAMLAVLKCGAAYVPIDSAYPLERIRYILEDCASSLLLTDAELAARHADLPVRQLVLEHLQAELARQPSSAPARDLDGTAPFYAIYTSGSTGQPKGAVVTHGGVRNLQHWYLRTLGWRQGDKVLLASATGFDLTQKNIFAPLLSGATLVMPSAQGYEPQALLQDIREQRITLLNGAPSAFYPLLDLAAAEHWRDLASLRALVLGGEPIRMERLRPWLDSGNGQCRVLNSYGPTECTDVVAWHEVDGEAADAALPIGRPVDNTQLYVLDRYDQPLPVGVPGEICVAGAGVGPGYLHREALTAATFVANPFGPGRLYRTGDLGRYRANGELEFLGRKDFQIKLRGLRIEPGEIEQALLRLDGVRDSLVLVRDERLLAYVLTDGGAAVQHDWRERLARFIPTYMLPQALLALAEWPLSANGKIDRRALPQPEAEHDAMLQAPQGEHEMRLATLWADTLQVPVEQIGRQSNFFHLGGHSLLATVLLTRIAEAFASAPRLRDLFERATLAEQAQLIAAASEQPASALPTLQAGPHPQRLPLSFEQQRLWFLEQLAPGSGEYSINTALTLTGELDVEALRQAFETLVERHAILRSRLLDDDQGGQLLIDAPRRFELAVEDYAGEPADWAEYQRQAAEAESARAFDLTQEYPLRVRLLRHAGANQALLLLGLHHCAADGWSVQVLLDELAASYHAARQGRRAELPALPVQYVDYALWQRSEARQQVYRQQLEYWQNRLENGDYRLELPTDLPRPAHLDNRAGTCFAQVPAALAERLRRFAQERQVTPFVLLLAGLKLFLGRYSGQQDLRIGTPVANRRLQAVQPLIGCFVNTLVIRSELTPTQRFGDYLAQLRQTVLDAQEHQDVPFEQVVEHLAPERDLAHTPLFQVAFVMQNSTRASLDWPGLHLQPLDIRSPAAKFDQNWEVHDDGEHLSVMLEYRASLFHESTMQAWLGQWLAFLEQLPQAVDTPLARLTPLSEADRQRQLQHWNDTTRHYPGPATLSEALARQVRNSPEAPALVYEGETLSYATLHQRADQLAQALVAQGIGREQVVAVCMERSIDLVVALVGIVKAGAAYLPLDPHLPATRLAFLLEDAACPLVLTHATWRERLPEQVPAWCLEQPLPEQASTARPPANQPDDLLYVLYTSGSTGQPKGVLNEHGALMNRLHWMQDAFAIGAGDRVLQKTPYGFDVSVWEFFWPLITGACLVLARPGGHQDSGYLMELIQRERITTLHFVPSMLQAFVSEPGLEDCTSLRQVFASGEALPLALQQRFQARHPARLINLYGPTEAAIDVSCWICDPASTLGFVPIGKPIANLRLYILDEALAPLPIGAVGELYIGGAGLARGYLNRPELTAERFVDSPFDAGQRLYRTGDRCRFLADGNIQYLGRLDHQVKLRGQRIELGEIDAALLAQPGVREAVTVLRDDLGTPQLVAYLVASESGLDVDRLQAELAQTLPAHMLPSVLVELAALPLNQNGKLDRKQLPRPQLEQAEAALEAPLGEVERRMAARWAELLEVPVELIGRDSHFFRLGGHSLLATLLLARLRQEYGQAPALRQLFEQPTLRAFSALLGTPATHAAAELTPQPRPERLPLSYAQQRLWFLEQLNPHAAEYNITSAVELSGPVRLDWLQQGLAEIIARHEVLRGRLLERGQGAELLIDTHSRAHLAIETLDEADWDAQVARRIDEESRQPFDLAAGPLIRGCLLHTERRTLLLLTLHHTVADDWSMQCLIDELAELYRARSEQREARLPALPVQYVDYALWQRLPEQAERYRQQLQYWQSALGDGDYQLELPTDHPRRAEPDSASGFHALVLPDALAQRLRQTARQQGVTLYVLLLAATQVLLGRLAGQRDVRIGTAVANRDLAQTQALIGCFVNTLVIRAEVDPHLAFEHFLKQVGERVLAAQEHQEVPFEQVVDALVSERDMTRTPLFQVLFAMQNARLRSDAWAPLKLREMEVPSNASSFDLSWEVHDDGERLSLRLKYKRQLFEADTIMRWADTWQQLLGEISSRPLAKLGELDLLGGAERDQQLQQWNATAKTYSGPHSLAQALAEQAMRSPDAPALVYAEQRLSYAQLHACSGAVARALRERGVGREQVVAVCMQRSVEMVVALLGIIRAGAAYLPLDPELPPARLALMLDDAGPALTLVQPGTASCLPAGTPRWSLDVSTLEDGPQPEPINQPGDLAYVIYTSGSTGQPKGVLNEHGALMNRLYWMQDAFPIGADDRVLQKTPYGFDVSVWEFFWPLITGACLVVAKPDGHRDSHYLAELIQRERITTLHFVPSMLQAFVGEPQLPRCTSLRQVFASGEALPLELQQRFQARHPARLINLYGPTEAAIDVSCWICDPASTLGFVPIGKPIANLRLYILDEALAPLPIGAVGELYIGGAGLARGYLNRPELTAERFVDSPFDAGQRLYRTGDRCRFLADGNIQYLGRLDHQVKLRGLRIELGEIDAALLDQPGIEAAVTVLREDLATPQLVAYLCGPEALDVEALKQRLGQQLPAHMVPAFMVQLPALPLSSNGKIDRKALPKPEVERQARQQRAPSNATEEVLCRLLGELLGIEAPSVDDNFFALGGDSILGLQFIAQARAQGIGLTPRQLFQQRTLADLALVANPVEQCQAEQGVLEGEAPLLPIQHWLLERPLAEPGHWNQSVLLKPNRPLQAEALQRTLQLLVEQHDALRLRFTREGGQWRQRYADTHQAVTFAQVHLAEPCTAQALRDCIAERVEATFDLASGPLIRALLIDLADGQQRLYLVAHHLVVDAVSWRLLLEDFSQLYPRLAAGQSIELPAKASSYRQWGQRLWQQAASPTVQAQRDYWLQQIRPGQLPADQPQADNRVADEVSLSGRLSIEETQALQQAQGSYRTQGHELLLAALAGALHQCSGARAIGIDLEGHGRDAAFAELDVSRTVGWFTQLYPVRLELPQGSDTGALIVAVKEQLRAAADKAMGYGLLRHQAETPLPAHRHSLLFNYLGQLDGVEGGGLLQLSDEPLPPAVAADSPRSHDLEVVLAVIGGRLQVEMKFAGLRYAPASRERLLQAYLAHLRTVIGHCQGNQTGQLSPTDFPLAKALNQKNLDTLLSKLKNKPISQS